MPAALEKCSIKFEFDNSEIRLVLVSFFLLYPFIHLHVLFLSQGHEQKEHSGKTRPKGLEWEPGSHTRLSPYDTGVQKTLPGEHDFIFQYILSNINTNNSLLF